MKYKWHIKEHNNISKEFLEVAYGSEIIAKLLLNRGITTPEHAKEYLEPSFYKETDPEEIPDLIIAVDRIIEAINNNEKITIFGDYDVDGVTSTSLLITALGQFTENIDFYIPNRLTEGYGLNNEAVKTIAKKHKANLLITCDCGITNYKETELANELGMDVIITDHHSLPGELPPAVAVLNPKLLPQNHKLHFLPGVGVAYKLAEALLKELSQSVIARSTEGVTKQSPNREIVSEIASSGLRLTRNDVKKEDLLDLVTLGMIADLAPLVDENRYLVQIGLEKLANTEKIGLKELLRVCGCKNNNEPTNGQAKNTTKPSVDHIGFGIAPRINAVGRLTDAKLAVKLLTTDNLLEAIHIACELEEQNRQRQILCEETLSDAVTLVSEQVDLKKDKCIVLAKEGWHHGVVGIVASRIVEKFSLPTILIAVDTEQNIARGSGRSIEKLNIVEALVANSNHLEKYGGHKAACGLSIKPENLNNFTNSFKDHVNNLLSQEDIGPVLNIDSEVPFSMLNIEFIKLINQLSPFGLANPVPYFVSKEVEIISIRNIGKNGQHLKLLLKSKNNDDIKSFEALIWNHDPSVQFNLKDIVKIVYTPKFNFYNGEVFIQLEVKDIELKHSDVTIRQKDKVTTQQSGEVKIFDFRKSDLKLKAQSSLYFAEIEQKNFLPLKTYSRSKISKAENLVFLEIPPDENVFLNIVRKVEPLNIYLAFSQYSTVNPQSCLKRLIGMLKYVQSSKNSKVNEVELQSALGINKTSLAFALETLKNIGFLSCEKLNDELNIDILASTRQNFTELIEYNLFVSELKQINNFREKLTNISLETIVSLLEKESIIARAGLKEKVEIAL